MESIQSFYAGKSIFMTGATGFMGKVLVEKLLRSCPDVAAIYVLVRAQRGKSGQERWNEITKQEVFDRLKKEFPDNLKKVKVMEGNMSSPHFDLEDELYEELKKNVSIIFHVAASVRFDEPLNAALETNVLSTKNVLEFALEAQKIDVFLHVSTSYSNTHLKYIEEKVYPPYQDWRKVVEVAKETDPNVLSLLSTSYIHPFANTYVFTKHLAEQVVNEHKDRIPTVILRPSIVVASWKEPMVGWVDNLNGPFALIAAACKGVIQTVLGKKETRGDYIPVDISVKSMIVAAWKKGIQISNDKYNIDVYNSSSIDKSITIEKMIEIGINYMKAKPFTKIVWIPRLEMTESVLNFRLQCFFKHLIPSLFLDFLAKLNGREPRLYKTHKKVINAMMVLQKFMTNEWIFENENFLRLTDEIPPESKKDFDYSFADIDVHEYIRNCCDTMYKYLLKENDSFESIEKHNKRIYLLDALLQSGAAIGAMYAAYSVFL